MTGPGIDIACWEAGSVMCGLASLSNSVLATFAPQGVESSVRLSTKNYILTRFSKHAPTVSARTKTPSINFQDEIRRLQEVLTSTKVALSSATREKVRAEANAQFYQHCFFISLAIVTILTLILVYPILAHYAQAIWHYFVPQSVDTALATHEDSATTTSDASSVISDTSDSLSTTSTDTIGDPPLVLEGSTRPATRADAGVGTEAPGDDADRCDSCGGVRGSAPLPKDYIDGASQTDLLDGAKAQAEVVKVERWDQETTTDCLPVEVVTTPMQYQDSSAGKTYASSGTMTNDVVLCDASVSARPSYADQSTATDPLINRSDVSVSAYIYQDQQIAAEAPQVERVDASVSVCFDEQIPKASQAVQVSLFEDNVTDLASYAWKSKADSTPQELPEGSLFPFIENLMAEHAARAAAMASTSQNSALALESEVAIETSPLEGSLVSTGTDSAPVAATLSGSSSSQNTTLPEPLQDDTQDRSAPEVSTEEDFLESLLNRSEARKSLDDGSGAALAGPAESTKEAATGMEPSDIGPLLTPDSSHVDVFVDITGHDKSVTVDPSDNSLVLSSSQEGEASHHDAEHEQMVPCSGPDEHVELPTESQAPDSDAIMAPTGEDISSALSDTDRDREDDPADAEVDQPTRIHVGSTSQQPKDEPSKAPGVAALRHFLPGIPLPVFAQDNPRLDILVGPQSEHKAPASPTDTSTTTTDKDRPHGDMIVSTPQSSDIADTDSVHHSEVSSDFRDDQSNSLQENSLHPSSDASSEVSWEDCTPAVAELMRSRQDRQSFSDGRASPLEAGPSSWAQDSDSQIPSQEEILHRRKPLRHQQNFCFKYCLQEGCNECNRQRLYEEKECEQGTACRLVLPTFNCPSYHSLEDKAAIKTRRSRQEREFSSFSSNGGQAWMTVKSDERPSQQQQSSQFKSRRRDPNTGRVSLTNLRSLVNSASRQEPPRGPTSQVQNVYHDPSSPVPRLRPADFDRLLGEFKTQQPRSPMPVNPALASQSIPVQRKPPSDESETQQLKAPPSENPLFARLSIPDPRQAQGGPGRGGNGGNRIGGRPQRGEQRDGDRGQSSPYGRERGKASSQNGRRPPRR